MNTVRIMVRTYTTSIHQCKYDAVITDSANKEIYKTPICKSALTATTLAESFVKANSLKLESV